MSSGANIGDGGPDGIGDAPTDSAPGSSSSSAGSTPGRPGPFYDVA